MRGAAFLPLLVVPLAWSPAAAPPHAVRSVPGARRGSHATGADPDGCAGRSLEGYCLPPARCGDGELDLDGLCLPTEGALGDEEGAAPETNAHIDRQGRRVVYENLPRRRDLPPEYSHYVFPIVASVGSGYDLDRPDELQRRGFNLSAVGHGGVDLMGARGAPVRAVALRGEVGDPLVVYVGPLFGNTVVLGHVVREGTQLRTYLALHGHLEEPAPGIVRGMNVTPGTVIGFVGDSGAIGIVHLHYETRLVRSGIDPLRVEPAGRLVDQEVSVPCDPRNVLPLR